MNFIIRFEARYANPTYECHTIRVYTVRVPNADRPSIFETMATAAEWNMLSHESLMGITILDIKPID